MFRSLWYVKSKGASTSYRAQYAESGRFRYLWDRGHPAFPPVSIWVTPADYELADVEHTTYLFSEVINEQLVFPLEDSEKRVNMSFRCHRLWSSPTWLSGHGEPKVMGAVLQFGPWLSSEEPCGNGFVPSLVLLGGGGNFKRSPHSVKF